MNFFQRVRERARRAAAAVARVGRRIFNRKERTQAEKTIQERTREKYTPQTGKILKTGESKYFKEPTSWTAEQEEKEKAKDFAKKKAQHDKAYKTFSKQYGFTRDEYDEFFDVMGGELNRLSQYLEGGSPTIYDQYREFKKKLPTATAEEFRDIMHITENLKTGQDQGEFYLNLTETMDTYTEFQSKLSGTMQDFQEFMQWVKDETPSLEGTDFQKRVRFEIEREKKAREQD